MRLYQEARCMLRLLDESCRVKAIYRLMDANSDGDDLLLDGKRFPLLRQQARQQDEDPYLCLSDYVRPLSQGVTDTVGVLPPLLMKRWKSNLRAIPINICSYRH